MVIIYVMCLIITVISKNEYPGHNTPLREEINKKWQDYYDCLKRDYISLGMSLQRKIVAKLLLPGEITILSCNNNCQRPFGEVATLLWQYKQFGQNESEILDLHPEMSILSDNSLKITNTRSEFAGYYTCHRSDTILAVYRVECPANDTIKKIYHNSANSYPTEYEIFGGKILIEIEWSNWSECNSCNTLGRKRKYGICMLVLSDEENNAGLWDEDISKLSNILKRYRYGLPCSSMIVPQSMKQTIMENNVTDTVMYDFCQVNCPNDTFNEVIMPSGTSNMKLLSILHEFRSKIPEVSREIIDAEVDTYVTLQCPGIVTSNVPLIWKREGIELVPEFLNNLTSGRISIDFFDRLIINHTNPEDSSIYSCWQRERLVGTVHLFVDSTLNETKVELKFVTVIILLVMVIVIGNRAIRQRKHGN